MGQRLNLEITYKGECVANAYYHWSGFSDSALNTILDACCAYEKDFAVDKESATILAVLMLEATGAGLKKKEIPVYQELCPSDDFEHQAGIDGYYGWICVSEKGMGETRCCAESDSTIEISDKECLITFNTFWLEDKEEWEEMYEKTADALPELPHDIIDRKMTIEEAVELSKEIDPKGQLEFLTKDKKQVLTWI